MEQHKNLEEVARIVFKPCIDVFSPSSRFSFVAALLFLVTSSTVPNHEVRAETAVGSKTSDAKEIPNDWKTCLDKGSQLKQNRMYDQAAPYLRKSFEIADSQFGPSDPRWYISLNVLAGN